MSYPNAQKIEFVGQLTSLATLINSLSMQSRSIYGDYFDRTYGSGGANELVAGDLVGSSYEGLPIASITAGITALENLIKYLDNQAVTQADYGSTFSNLKR